MTSSSNRCVKVAATQLFCGFNAEDNITQAEKAVREAAARGANIILLQELFKTVYFCQEQDIKYFDWAESDIENSSFLTHFANLAKELHVVLPISFFERKNNAFYNSIIVFDVDGTSLGTYRKTHIPDGLGYQEKFYFTPGDTGFKVFPTAYCKLGVGICWDQWFPETARSLALQGAELILYPTAIGSEPGDITYDSAGHWERVMCGHAASNMIPVVASNRVGKETFDKSDITFYGSSFICDQTGKVLQRADRTSSAILVQEFDLASIEKNRIGWGIFRDRRPEMYSHIFTKDGNLKQHS
jgi:N-carbamoylputrescine amidase